MSAVRGSAGCIPCGEIRGGGTKRGAIILRVTLSFELLQYLKGTGILIPAMVPSFVVVVLAESMPRLTRLDATAAIQGNNATAHPRGGGGIGKGVQLGLPFTFSIEYEL